MVFRVQDLKKKNLEKEFTIQERLSSFEGQKKSHLDLLTMNLHWVMFCLSIESGLYGRGLKSVRSFCPLAFPLPTQPAETLHGFYAFLRFE